MRVKRILVDLSFTLPHHGHIRLLKKASKYGEVIVALTSDDEVLKHKGYQSELDYKSRREILNSIKYVHKVIKSNWLITDDFLKKHKIDYLLHGEDNSNIVDKKKVILVKRTKNISSSIIRKKSFKNYQRLLKKI